MRRILIGGVGLVRGRVRDVGPAMVAVCDRLEPELERSGWFPSAPFACVNHVIRFGTEHSAEPEIGRVSRDGELPTAIEVPMKEFQAVARDPHQLQEAVLSATLPALRAVGERHRLPLAWLESVGRGR